MKNKLLWVCAALSVTFLACSKDDDDLALQAHDDNRMMDTMHVMMDKMQAMEITDDPDIDFPAMMIMHHQGAISMSSAQIESGQDDSLKQIAQQMIDMQQMEIEELQQILDDEAVNNSVPAFSMKQHDNMMKMDQMADIQLITGDIDNDFATLMILHHNSAIENSEAYLMYGTNAELKTMAREMIEMQKMEIEQLSEWLKNNKR